MSGATASTKGRGCNSHRLKPAPKTVGENRTLLQHDCERQPCSVTDMAAMIGGTLNNLVTAAVARLDKSKGRACRPVLAVRRVDFEVDLRGPT